MISNGIRSPDAAEPSGTRATRERDHRLRLLLVMAQGPRVQYLKPGGHMPGLKTHAPVRYEHCGIRRSCAWPSSRTTTRCVWLSGSAEYLNEMKLRLGRWRVGKTVLPQQSSGRRSGCHRHPASRPA